ncbi:MAG: aldehyde dehydrogenase family protein [Gemmobacter sp.]|uniref:aldehyde dehydrogenase family protein n=1 Tax=Gemmobacter sp. TaxID=1898957 RepID=UPI00391AE274
MISQHLGQFLIGGAWVEPGPGASRMGVENPATEAMLAEVALGTAADAEAAILAARAAFDGWTATPVAERIALLERVLALYRERIQDFADAMRLEMGAPAAWAREAQAWAGEVHLEATLEAAQRFHWEEQRGTTRIIREGIGVCGLITPWNWPMNQIACKVAPALVAGCTMVLKPSELAPLSAALFAEIMQEAGCPPGVFNLVNGTGAEVGQVLASHPAVDMVSFTGSTRAGVAVAQAAAPTVKRVAQELGGKSPNILLPGCDFAAAVRAGVEGCMANAGQSCDAPTRMLVPRARMAEALEIAAAAAEAQRPGDPLDPATTMGPLIGRMHWDKVQGLIAAGIAEGARLVAGGPGRPQGLNAGHFARATVFGDVTPDMTIAREEIFGPVLAVMGYDSLDEAVRIANDTVYGLAAYVQGPEAEARAVGRRLRAGQVSLNNPPWDVHAPFGGYKQSGNGREYADWGIHDFCEVKALVGHG